MRPLMMCICMDIDSGVSDHMTGNQNFFTTYSQCDRNISVTIVDGSKSKVI